MQVSGRLEELLQLLYICSLIPRVLNISEACRTCRYMFGRAKSLAALMDTEVCVCVCGGGGVFARERSVANVCEGVHPESSCFNWCRLNTGALF